MRILSVDVKFSNPRPREKIDQNTQVKLFGWRFAVTCFQRPLLPRVSLGLSSVKRISSGVKVIEDATNLLKQSARRRNCMANIVAYAADNSRHIVLLFLAVLSG